MVEELQIMAMYILNQNIHSMTVVPLGSLSENIATQILSEAYTENLKFSRNIEIHT